MYIKCGGGWLAGKINGMRKHRDKNHCRSWSIESRKCAYFYNRGEKTRLKTMYTCVRYMFYFVVAAAVEFAVDYRSIRVNRAGLNSTNWFRHWAVRASHWALSIQLICMRVWGVKCSFKSPHFIRIINEYHLEAKKILNQKNCRSVHLLPVKWIERINLMWLCFIIFSYWARRAHTHVCYAYPHMCWHASCKFV